jgi:hypothetical protein
MSILMPISDFAFSAAYALRSQVLQEPAEERAGWAKVRDGELREDLFYR